MALVQKFAGLDISDGDLPTITHVHFFELLIVANFPNIYTFWFC